jgi:phenylacetate-CoA ligase
LRLFDISLHFKGLQIENARKVYSSIKTRSAEDRIHYINTQRKAILQHHLNHNPFYQKYRSSIDLNNWQTVPVLTKNELQSPLETRLSKGFTKRNVYINKTSGSSGHPLIFAKDKWCHALTWAEIMDRFSWYDIDFNRSKQARFYGIPLDKRLYYKERLKDYLSNRYRFSVFNLSNTALELVLTKFKSYPFDYINGYTSAIVQFARFLKERGVILTSVCPSLKHCIVTAEMVFPDDRQLMENYFGVPVINEYGASELGLIAFESPQGHMRLNAETLYIEVLDDNDMPVAPNESGRLVVTALYNKAHPFIRYDLGDTGIISLGDAAEPELKQLVGRSDDIVVLPSGKKAAGLTFYYITKSVITNTGNVQEFVIDQCSPSDFLIKYISKNEMTEHLKSTIKQKICDYLEPNLSIRFQKMERLKRSKSGKLKQFNRLF